jgi:hypothetical protein
MHHENFQDLPAAAGGPAASIPPLDRRTRQRIYDELVAGFRSGTGQDPEARWRWLAAAHVVGQMDLRMHWHSHRTMLSHAIAQGDAREAAGQLFRLALVPLGHALGRLPVGNIGRATVSAFRPMEPAPAVRELIAQAEAKVRRTGGA